MVGFTVVGGEGTVIVVAYGSVIVIKEGRRWVVVVKYVIFVGLCREGKIIGEVVCWGLHFSNARWWCGSRLHFDRRNWR